MSALDSTQEKVELLSTKTEESMMVNEQDLAQSVQNIEAFSENVGDSGSEKPKIQEEVTGSSLIEDVQELEENDTPYPEKLEKEVADGDIKESVKENEEQVTDNSLKEEVSKLIEEETEKQDYPKKPPTNEEDDDIDFETLLQGEDEDDLDALFDQHDNEIPEETVQVEDKPKKKRKKKVKSTSSSSTRESSISHDKSGIDDETGSEESYEDQEKEVEEEEKPEMSEFEKYQYYLKYDKLEKEFYEEKNRNDFYHKKLANYFQKKRMFHVLQETKVQLDTQKKYEKLLDEFDRKNEMAIKERENLLHEIEELKSICAVKERETEMCFQKLQQAEYEVSKDVSCSESNKAHVEKLVERCLKRQKIELGILIKIRYEYIRLRNKIAETQDALNALDSFGPNLRLIDYEQLKIDNRNLQDKLEEKECELIKVRQKCQHASQILAHKREKTKAVEEDIVDLQERLENISGEAEDVREQLNMLKMERDGYRAAIEQLKANAGLLSKPKLLQDFSNTMEEIEILTQKLENTKNECVDTAKKVELLRRYKGSGEKLMKIKSQIDGGESVHTLEGKKNSSFSDLELIK